jgi:hypothetical protein
LCKPHGPEFGDPVVNSPLLRLEPFDQDVPRITSSLRFGTRTDREQAMEDKVRSVEEKLRR